MDEKKEEKPKEEKPEKVKEEEGRAVILKPGVWNSITYTPEEIRKCWIKLPNELPVFEEFQETVDHFVGLATDFRIEEKTGNLTCNIRLWKEYPNIKYIMVMPNVTGDITPERKIINFVINNISLVMSPLARSQRRMEVSVVR